MWRPFSTPPSPGWAHLPQPLATPISHRGEQRHRRRARGCASFTTRHHAAAPAADLLRRGRRPVSGGSSTSRRRQVARPHLATHIHSHTSCSTIPLAPHAIPASAIGNSRHETISVGPIPRCLTKVRLSQKREPNYPTAPSAPQVVRPICAPLPRVSKLRTNLAPICIAQRLG